MFTRNIWSYLLWPLRIVSLSVFSARLGKAKVKGNSFAEVAVQSRNASPKKFNKPPML